LQASSNSSFIHDNQATASISTKRSNPTQQSVCRVAYMETGRAERGVGKLWHARPCSSATIWTQPLHLWFHFKSSYLYSWAGCSQTAPWDKQPMLHRGYEPSSSGQFH
jgi:hypothetical protein